MLKQRVVYFNGKLIPFEQATLHLMSHSLGRASTIFEVLSVHETANGPALFRLDAHVERFMRSAGLLAIGVARAYLFAGELGACLHNPDLPPESAAPYSKDDTGHREFVVKLSKIQDRILTAEGKRLATERHEFMVAFFKRFLSEYRGEV